MHSTLPLAVRQHIDTLCDAFEAAWQQHLAHGESPRIEDYLGHAREPLRSALLATGSLYQARAGPETLRLQRWLRHGAACL
ncbi:MAG: hypothetical protein K6T86_12270 [Pirellulales bacterium]|nr:hypothetical protein [Pirellulales bacterium]